ncbi:VanZ family protein [Streptomyces sp. T-3]|nr:VanZ family protein [Streptomyces sp. T-3]
MFFPIAFLIGVLGTVAVYVATGVRGRPRQISRRIALALLWFWAAGVVYFTFGTPSGGGRALNLQPLDVTNSADIVDAALNVLMFAPGGLLLALLPVRWYQATVFGLLGSLAIEVTQYLTRSGRSTDINDLTGNTLGTLIGFACTASVVTLAGASRRARVPRYSR